MTARRFSTVLLVLIVLLSLVVSPKLRHWTQAVKAESMAGETEGDIQRRNQGAFARALGELRSAASGNRAKPFLLPAVMPIPSSCRLPESGPGYGRDPIPRSASHGGPHR